MEFDPYKIGGAILGGLLGGQDSKQSQSSTKTPYGPATGWLNSSIAQGQNLQNLYSANPFSMGQQQAYTNSLGLSNTARGMVPGLVNQMGSQKFFDRANPLGRPTPFNFSNGDTSIAGAGATQLGGQGFAPITGSLGFSNPVAVGNGTAVASAGYMAPRTQDSSHERDGAQGKPSWYDTTTSQQRADFFGDNPWAAAITGFSNNAIAKANPYGLFDTAQAQRYAAETTANRDAAVAAAAAIAAPAIAPGTLEAQALAAAYAQQGGGGGGGSYDRDMASNRDSYSRTSEADQERGRYA